MNTFTENQIRSQEWELIRLASMSYKSDFISVILVHTKTRSLKLIKENLWVTMYWFPICLFLSVNHDCN